MNSDGDAVEAFLRGRPRPVVLTAPVSPTDVPGAGMQDPREGFPVVYLVMRFRRSGVEARPGGRRVDCEYDAVLDSLHATPESAREREAVLAPDYETLIETVEVYSTGVDVVPYAEDGPPHETPVA
jgi:hypothetical protein